MFRVRLPAPLPSSTFAAAALLLLGACESERAPAGQTAGFALDEPAPAEPMDPSGLTKFVDPLPLPAVLEPAGRRRGATYYEVAMTELSQQLHSELPPTTVWGYAGSYPGPTLEARVNEPVAVRWTNELPTEHLLPVDTTVHGAGHDQPEVRTVAHLHGGHTPPESDGHPEAWFTREFAETGEHFATQVYEYPNRQRAATLWYHDHALGITRLNVYAGLAGFYLLRDAREERLGLPSGDYEIPLALQDRSFNADGSLWYPAPEIAGVSPSIVPEVFGNTAVVNGKVWPYLEVEPRKYRFRLLAGGNARFWRVELVEANAAGEPLDGGGGALVPGPRMHQIGTDGGLLPAPVTIDERLLLGPGERADVVVDFADFAGRTLLLHNDAPSPFKGDGVEQDDEAPLPDVMLFRVAQVSVADDSKLPRRLDQVGGIPEKGAARTRDLTLDEGEDAYGRLLLLLEGLRYEDPVVTQPQLGSTEIWRLINRTEDVHPIHLHLVQFRILDRRPFDMEAYETTGELVWLGPAVPPAPNEDGWKDTVQAPPGHATRIIARFDIAGEYVWHCHILEHEDHEMMRPYEVIRGVEPAVEMAADD